MTISLIRAANQFQFMTRGLATFEAQVARDLVFEAQQTVEEDRELSETAREGAQEAEAGALAAKNTAAGYAGDIVSQGFVPTRSSMSNAQSEPVQNGIVRLLVFGVGEFAFSATEPTGVLGQTKFQSSDGKWWALITVPRKVADALDSYDAVNVRTLQVELDAVYALLSKSIGIEAAISKWNTDTADLRVLYGGGTLVQSGTSGVSPSTTGRTFLGTSVSPAVGDRIRQPGLVKRIRARLIVPGSNPTDTVKFKLFRPNGDSYDFVAETPTFSPVTGGVYQDVIFNLATPLACQMGDVIAIWLKANSNVSIAASGSGKASYFAGDLVGSVAAADLTNVAVKMCLAFEGAPPFMVAAGDSIFEGHNGGEGNQWHTVYHDGPAGNPLSEVYHHIKDQIPSLIYQNLSRGGEDWSQTAGRVADINAVRSRAVHVHCGVNDISKGRSLSDLLASMSAFKAGLTNGQRLVIDAILPWRNGTDAQALQVRQSNVAMKQWCIDNGAFFIDCHDEMGQVRASTGQIDNLKTIYDQDGVHLTTPAGTSALGGILTKAIKREAWV